MQVFIGNFLQLELKDSDQGFLSGAPGPTRTGDLQIRSLTLYPTELRVRGEDRFSSRLECNLSCRRKQTVKRLGPSAIAVRVLNSSQLRGGYTTAKDFAEIAGIASGVKGMALRNGREGGGVSEGIWTPDRWSHNPELCQLSYAHHKKSYPPHISQSCAGHMALRRHILALLCSVCKFQIRL
jgi:hypothetical protein